MTKRDRDELKDMMARDPVFAAEILARRKAQRAEFRAWKKTNCPTLCKVLTADERAELELAAQTQVLDAYARYASELASWRGAGMSWKKPAEPAMTVARTLRWMENTPGTLPSTFRGFDHKRKASTVASALTRLKEQGKLASSLGPGENGGEARCFEPVDFQSRT